LIFNDEVKIIANFCNSTKYNLEFGGEMDEKDEILKKFQNFVNSYNIKNKVDVKIIGDKEGFFWYGKLGKVKFDYKSDGKVIFIGILENY
jgi:hypothetical protein